MENPWDTMSGSERLKAAVLMLFGAEQAHLDHSLPLRIRAYNQKIKDVAARYTPNANDPEYLVYRTAADHRFKTNMRGEGAQHPDRVLIKRERRRERPKKAKRKWQSRPFTRRSKSKSQSRKSDSLREARSRLPL